MGKLIAIALFLLWPAEAGAANAAGLQGQWRIEVPLQPNYSGVVLIDAEQRVTWAATTHADKAARLQGYVTSIDGPKVEIALTDRATVERAHCVIQSAELLHCYLTTTHNAKVSPGFMLRRVGPGPQRLPPLLP